MYDRVAGRCAQRLGQALAQPSSWTIARHRQGRRGTNRSAIDPAGDQFQCRRGSTCRNGAVSDGARHGQNIALFMWVGLDRLRTEHRALPPWSAVSTPN